MTTDVGQSATLQVSTPGGCGAHLRTPALLPYLVQHKGKRIRGSQAYNTAKPLLGRPKRPKKLPPRPNKPDHIKYEFKE